MRLSYEAGYFFQQPQTILLHRLQWQKIKKESRFKNEDAGALFAHHSSRTLQNVEWPRFISRAIEMSKASVRWSVRESGRTKKGLDRGKNYINNTVRENCEYTVQIAIFCSYQHTLLAALFYRRPEK